MNKKIVYCLVVLSTQCFIQSGFAADATKSSAPGAEVVKSSEIPEKKKF